MRNGGDNPSDNFAVVTAQRFSQPTEQRNFLRIEHPTVKVEPLRQVDDCHSVLLQIAEGTSRSSSLSLPVMEHIAPHLIATLNRLLSSRFFEKFQKFFPDTFHAPLYCLLRATANFSDFLKGKIVQCMEQKPLPLLLGTEGQRRQNFPSGFHAADIFLRRFAVGQTALGRNYVLVIASLVPVVYQLTVKASVKLRGHLPKLAERGGIFIGQITPMLLAGNYHFAFSSRPDFAGV